MILYSNRVVLQEKLCDRGTICVIYDSGED